MCAPFWFDLFWFQQQSQGMYIDSLVEDCINSSALAMELLQSFTEPSIRSMSSRFPRIYAGILYNDQRRTSTPSIYE